MMYHNMKNAENTDEKMEYIQMKGVIRSDCLTLKYILGTHHIGKRDIASS